MVSLTTLDPECARLAELKAPGPECREKGENRAEKQKAGASKGEAGKKSRAVVPFDFPNTKTARGFRYVLYDINIFVRSASSKSVRDEPRPLRSR